MLNDVSKWKTRSSPDNSDRRKPTGFDQDLPEFDAIIRIDIQDLHGGRSTLCLTHKDWPHPAEVAFPLLFARVKQSDGFIIQSP